MDCSAVHLSNGLQYCTSVKMDCSAVHLSKWIAVLYICQNGLQCCTSIKMDCSILHLSKMDCSAVHLSKWIAVCNLSKGCSLTLSKWSICKSSKGMQCYIYQNGLQYCTSVKMDCSAVHQSKWIAALYICQNGLQCCTSVKMDYRSTNVSKTD
ncbi:hypothetical protein HNY73_009512 [Argiope bruennichi]|uniref:Uncharacterized protein n=1 Tax=Argiope bruennichi TaxID=94029 RepID=A0A8T0FEX9_ARGBR|nr:hypothetical protein HNY73_009512 [Argiope bruennichi]